MQSSLELHAGAPDRARRWLHTGHCGCSLGKEVPTVPCGLPALGAAGHEMLFLREIQENAPGHSKAPSHPLRIISIFISLITLLKLPCNASN